MKKRMKMEQNTNKMYTEYTFYVYFIHTHIIKNIFLCQRKY